MEKLLQGIRHFQEKIHGEKQSLFNELVQEGQNPRVLFITCSDSRVVPQLITQTEPGDMFIIQNAGNIIPPHGAAHGGIGASIEYAVSVLNVEDIVLCGHSHCGAMAALINNTNLDKLPNVQHWLSFAEATRAIVDSKDDGMSDKQRLELCIKQNIPVQLGHLKTLPAVAAKMAQRKITIHGWVYQIETGEIEVWDRKLKRFVPFEEAYPTSVAAKK